MKNIENTTNLDEIFHAIVTKMLAGEIAAQRGNNLMRLLDAGRKLFTGIAGLQRLAQYCVPGITHIAPETYIAIYNNVWNQVLADEMSEKIAIMLVRNVEKQLRSCNSLLVDRVNVKLAAGTR